MKFRDVSILVILGIIALAFSAQAETEMATSVKKHAKQTDLTFAGSSVDGKYHSAGSGSAEIDADKNLGALIGVRKNFKDKLSAERNRLAKTDGKGNTP